MVHDQFICRFGIPLAIHTDQARDFTGKVMGGLCRALRIDKTRTCPWNPRSDGQCERFNRTIETMLRQTVSPDQTDWDLLLPALCAAYRATRHESTGESPNMMMLGRELPMPAEVAFGRPGGSTIRSPTFYVGDLMDRWAGPITLLSPA